LTCDVAWIAPGTGTNVTIWGTVTKAGELDATATVTSLVEPELNPADNTMTLKLGASGGGGGGGTSTTGTAVAALGCSAFGTPLLARRQGSSLLLSTALQTQAASNISVTAADSAGKPLTLMSHTRLGTNQLAASGPIFTTAAPQSQALPLVVLLPASLTKGRLFVAATNTSGANTLVIPFTVSTKPPRIGVSHCGNSGLRARVSGNVIIVSGALAVDEAAALRIDAVTHGKTVFFGGGSVLGTRRFARRVSHPSVSVDAGQTPFSLRLTRTGRITRVQLRVTATDARGRRSSVVLRFAG
jgi:hypothetical protein